MHGFGARLGFPRRIARAYGATRTLRLPPLRLRGMRTGSRILLLQTLAEFSSVAIRKAGIEVDAVRTTIDAWRAVLPRQGTQDKALSVPPRRGDLSACKSGTRIDAKEPSNRADCYTVTTALAGSLCSLRSHANAWATMVCRSSKRGCHLRIEWARSRAATRSAGSPARRAANSTLTSDAFVVAC
jgi:hypothetical protein